MVDGTRHVLGVVGAVGTGAMGGFFLAFSTIAMSGLRRIAPPEGLRAMQAINQSANSSPVLLVSLMGTGVACAVAVVTSIGRLDEAASVYQLVAAGLYLVGTLGLTIVFHVPRNNDLDLLDAASPASIGAWRDYARVWTAGNHVRTVSSLLAMIAFVRSLRAE